MSKSKIFVFCCLSFSLGILAASKFFLPANYIYLFLAASCLFFTVSFYINRQGYALIALFLFCVGVGALRLNASLDPNQYDPVFDTKQQLEGYVIEDPDIRSNVQLVTFRPKNYDQNLLLTQTLSQKFFYGDYVEVEGRVTQPKNLEDFDYQKYLERFNIYGIIQYPKVLILKSNQLNPLKRFLLKIKAVFSERLSLVLKEPQKSLALGILIGGHGTLPKNIVDAFNATGTSHVIAVSGFNITIIVAALASLAYVLGRRASFWLAVAAIISFVIITGAGSSVVRAGIMGFLLLLSFNIGRQYAILPSLFFAGLIMLLINPKILYWDIGFQLSFAATLGIVFFLPVLEKLGKKIPNFFGLKTLVLTTISAILATLPLILYNFGTVSLSALVVNILILPFIPFAMLFGFLSVLPFLGAGFALIANLLLVYIINAVSYFAQLPFSSLAFQIPAWLFYCLAFFDIVLYFVLKYLSLNISEVE